MNGSMIKKFLLLLILFSLAVVTFHIGKFTISNVHTSTTSIRLQNTTIHSDSETKSLTDRVTDVALRVVQYYYTYDKQYKREDDANSISYDVDIAGGMGMGGIFREDDDNETSTRSNPPILVLHIGPHKTGTSSIQCELTHYRKELYENANVAYMGRIYSACINNADSHDDIGWIDINKLLDCFRKASTEECINSETWQELVKHLANFSKSNKSVILSHEGFTSRIISPITIISKDNRQQLFELFNRYYPGRVHIVTVYRHYYEWMHSMWNEISKPYFHNGGDGNSYKTDYQKWPSEGGKIPQTFLEFMNDKQHDDDDAPISYCELAGTENIHVIEYLKRFWRNYTNVELVLNLHELRKEDTTTSFLRAILPPLAGDVFAKAKQNSGFISPSNPTRSIDYDRLVLVAHGKGLLNKTRSSRQALAMATEKQLLKTLNATIVDGLPLKCLNETQQQKLLQRSLEYEKQINPNQTESISNAEHESAFWEAVKENKFCNLDVDKLIEDPTVQDFFDILIKHT